MPDSSSSNPETLKAQLEDLHALDAEDLDNTHPINAPLDKDSAFLLFTIFVGDYERTAHALGVPAETIRDVAQADNWDKRIAPLLTLKKGTKPGDFERAVNRAMNFVQAHRMRMFLERVLRNITGMDGRELQAFLFPIRMRAKRRVEMTGGEPVVATFSTRALADLASALEKVHTMSYLALNDTATERKERGDEEDDNGTAAELHLKLAAAMSAGGVKRSVKDHVLAAQSQFAQELASKDLKPAPVDELRDEE